MQRPVSITQETPRGGGLDLFPKQKPFTSCLLTSVHSQSLKSLPTFWILLQDDCSAEGKPSGYLFRTHDEQRQVQDRKHQEIRANQIDNRLTYPLSKEKTNQSAGSQLLLFQQMIDQ